MNKLFQIIIPVAATVAVVCLGLYFVPGVVAKFADKMVVGHDYYFKGSKFATLPEGCSSAETETQGKYSVEFACPDGSKQLFINGVEQ